MIDFEAVWDRFWTALGAQNRFKNLKNQAALIGRLGLACLLELFSLGRRLGDATWDHFEAIWMLYNRFWINF